MQEQAAKDEAEEMEAMERERQERRAEAIKQATALQSSAGPAPPQAGSQQQEEEEEGQGGRVLSREEVHALAARTGSSTKEGSRLAPRDETNRAEVQEGAQAAVQAMLAQLRGAKQGARPQEEEEAEAGQQQGASWRPPEDHQEALRKRLGGRY